MGYDAKKGRAGQAMTEFVIAILAIIMIIVAAVEFVPIFLDDIGLLKEVREEAGTRAVSADSGIVAADRQDEFSFDVPGLLDDDKITGGTFSEKVYMPAANLAMGVMLHIPNIAGMVETLRFTNRDGTSEFVSGLLTMDRGQALARARGALAGAGWTPNEIAADDAIVFTLGDPIAPSAVAAVHAGYADDGVSTCLTVIARTVGAP
jgi:hypothetical protein